MSKRVYEDLSFVALRQSNQFQPIRNARYFRHSFVEKKPSIDRKRFSLFYESSDADEQRRAKALLVGFFFGSATFTFAPFTFSFFHSVRRTRILLAPVHVASALTISALTFL
jgi:hypothetical protein